MQSPLLKRNVISKFMNSHAVIRERPTKMPVDKCANGFFFAKFMQNESVIFSTIHVATAYFNRRKKIKTLQKIEIISIVHWRFWLLEMIRREVHIKWQGLCRMLLITDLRLSATGNPLTWKKGAGEISFMRRIICKAKRCRFIASST